MTRRMSFPPTRPGTGYLPLIIWWGTAYYFLLNLHSSRHRGLAVERAVVADRPRGAAERVREALPARDTARIKRAIVSRDRVRDRIIVGPHHRRSRRHHER